MMVDPGLSDLPAFLTSDAGLSSGFMSGQIAAAAMVAENRQKAHPASVDSVPTVANQEDHVSMATHGARRLTGMAETLNNIMAIELLACIEGTDHIGLTLSPRLAAVKDLVRSRVGRMNKDRWFAPDYEAARQSGQVRRDRECLWGNVVSATQEWSSWDRQVQAADLIGLQVLFFSEWFEVR